MIEIPQANLLAASTYWSRATDRKVLMGLRYVRAVAHNEAGKRVPVKFLVDSGAGYALLPYRVWRTLGLKGTESIRC